MNEKFLFLLCFFVINVLSLPVVEKNSISGALYYLLKYGYVPADKNSDTASLLSENGLNNFISDFQAFAGMNITGKLNDETIEMMNTPRCGVKDFVGHGGDAKKRRKKRYALQGSRWRTKDLTYRITRYPTTSRFKKDEVDDEIRAAFLLWEDVTPLKFTRKSSGSVHIEIRFETGEHGDGDPFDGPSGTLAHAYFPQFGGDAHFDNQEFWTINEFRGTNLKQTAAHEFGHSLGLSHSDVRSALMAPFYRGWIPDLKLDQDDIDAIQALYGENVGEEKPTPTAPPKEPESNDEDIDEEYDEYDEDDGSGVNNAPLCRNPNVDAIFPTRDGNYWVFKGSQYWLLTEDSVAEGYPRNIGSDWDGLPDNIDAALTWTINKKTYIFKGSQYWKFTNKRLDSGYPRLISEGFPGIPDNIDAAFVWGGNGKMYFFKDDLFYKFDPEKRPPVNNKYPKKITNWGLPNDQRLEAAVKWTNGYTYFFQNGQYYRFNDRRFRLDKGNPRYPRSSAEWWFGCDVSEDDGSIFFASGVEKNEDNTISLFDEEGNEDLDVVAGDE